MGSKNICTILSLTTRYQPSLSSIISTARIIAITSSKQRQKHYVNFRWYNRENTSIKISTKWNWNWNSMAENRSYSFLHQFPINKSWSIELNDKLTRSNRFNSHSRVIRCERISIFSQKVSFQVNDCDFILQLTAKFYVEAFNCANCEIRLNKQYHAGMIQRRISFHCINDIRQSVSFAKWISVSDVSHQKEKLTQFFNQF